MGGNINGRSSGYSDSILREKAEREGEIILLERQLVFV